MTPRGGGERAWSASAARPIAPPASRPGPSTRRFPRAPIPRSWARRWWWCALTPPRWRCRPSARAGRPTGSWPTRRSAPTPAARWPYTASRCLPRPSPDRRWCAPATTRRLTPPRGARSCSVPPGARFPSCRWRSTPPVSCARRGTSRALWAPLSGECVLGGRARRDPPGDSLPGPAQRLGAAAAQVAALPVPRPLVVPARRGRPVRVHRAGGHRRLSDVLLRPQHRQGGLPRPLRAAARLSHEPRLQVGARHLLHGQGRAADPPDPPLGSRRLRGGDRRAPAAHLLYRRLPQAARAHLRHRGVDAVHHPARGLSRLLDGRRPALGHGAGDRILGRPVDPVTGRQPGPADLGPPLPRRPVVLVAHVRRPRVHPPGRHRHADVPAPGAGGLAPPHPVSAPGAPERAQAGGRPRLPRTGSALAGAAGGGGRRAVPARRAGPDQPGLAVGALYAVAGHQRRPARLVPGVADRGDAPGPPLRRDARQIHPDTESVLGWGPVPPKRPGRPGVLALARAAAHRGPRGAQRA